MLPKVKKLWNKSIPYIGIYSKESYDKTPEQKINI